MLFNNKIDPTTRVLELLDSFRIVREKEKVIILTSKLESKKYIVGQKSMENSRKVLG